MAQGMNRIWPFGILVALVITTSSMATPTLAGAGDGPGNDAIQSLLQIRYIKEGDPGVTTSKCIGNPITPLCVADTKKASGLYEDDRLYEIFRGERPGTAKLITPPPYNPNTFCYSVIGYWHYLKGDIAMREADFIKPGDVALQIRNGVMMNGVCDLYYYRYDFRSLLTRKGPYGWYVVVNHHMIDYVRSPEYYRGQKTPVAEPRQ
jgi:hypothetical protein